MNVLGLRSVSFIGRCVSSAQSVLCSECPLLRVSSVQSVLCSECPLLRVSSVQSVGSTVDTLNTDIALRCFCADIQGHPLW